MDEAVHPLTRRRIVVRAVILAVALTALLAGPAMGAAAVPRSLAQAVTASEIDQARARILADTNAARSAAGLGPLTENPELDGVAQGCTQQQADADVMAHCPGFADRYPAGWRWAGENVAMGYAVTAVVNAWMNSPGHRANILRGDATHIGIGFARAADGSLYYTQNFGTYPNGLASTSCQGSTATAGSSPVFRFWSPVYQGHFYTISAAECRQVVSTLSRVWRYEGVAYAGFGQQATGTVPLYRFYSRAFNGHFYTTSQSERDQVIATMPDLWTYEGTAYHVYPPGSGQANTTAVYRFWSASARHHFYTASAVERDTVIATLSGVWSYESEAFRVPSS